jgi:hypothetical protein
MRHLSGTEGVLLVQEVSDRVAPEWLPRIWQLAALRGRS